MRRKIEKLVVKLRDRAKEVRGRALSCSRSDERLLDRARVLDDVADCVEAVVREESDV